MANYLIIKQKSPSQIMTDFFLRAAGVEPEAVTTTIGIYADLPNVYRITDILIFGTHSLLNY